MLIKPKHWWWPFCNHKWKLIRAVDEVYHLFRGYTILIEECEKCLKIREQKYYHKKYKHNK